MSLQIRRGTDAQRQAVVFDLGEILYTTDTKKFYVGDGTTLGGNNILATSAGTGLTWNSTTQTLNFSGTLSGYTTDNLAQGTVNLYYTPSRAKTDIASMFTATGSSTVTGTVTATTALSISFVGTLSTINTTGILTYVSGTVPQVGMLLTGTGITAGTYIVSGTSPTFVLSQVPTAGTNIAISGAISTVTVGSATGLVALEPFIVTGSGGGNLTAGTYYIINPSAGTNQITLATSLVNAQNSVAITNLVTNGSIPTTTFTAGGPDSNITFVYNPTTQTMSINSAASGIASVSADTNPSLGGNLNIGNYNISTTGTGTISIKGNISTTNGNFVTSTGNFNATNGSFTTATLGIGGSNIVSTASPLTSSTFTASAPINFGTTANPNTAYFNSSQAFAVFTGITSGANNSGLVSQISRGTLASPTAVQPGDGIFYSQGTGYDGTNFQTVGAFGLFTDPNAAVTTGHVPGLFGAVTISATGSQNSMQFNSKGVLTITGAMQVGSYAGSGAYPTGVKGMIIYDSNTNHFYGYNGAWVQFTGT